MKLISKNPSNNYEILWEVEISTDEEIEEKVKNANEAKKLWKELGIQKRIKLLKPICEEFKEKSLEIAELISKEIGKPIRECIDETNIYTEEFDWFINNAENILKDEITYEDENSIHKIIYEPFWTSAVITPWNFPFGMAIRWIIPNLIAGNTVVFKISEECPLVWKLIEKIINKHNLPKWVFSEIYGAWDIGEKLSKSDINLIWFTWSTKVWQILYKTAWEKFIKAILEMGGSNPCIIFENVNIDKYIEIVYNGRFQNCGQVCDAIKRCIVQESIFDEFVFKLKEFIKTKKIWNPLNYKTDIWSLVAERQLILLKSQLEEALDKGAKIIIGANEIQNLKGAFFEPTILINITKDMKIWKEEVFWPILPIIKFKTEEEAIELANDTIYWLGWRVISKDEEQARRIALKIEAGSIEINEWNRWLTCNPFWWYKKSWMWRELWNVWFKELSQIKVISMSK